MGAHEKRAAVRFDEIAERPLSDVTVEEFVHVLEEHVREARPVSALGSIRVKDVLAGMAVGKVVWPEKKKMESIEVPDAVPGSWRPLPVPEKFKREDPTLWQALPQDPMPFQLADFAARLTAIEQKLSERG
jgi:hypothetical protein